MKVLAIGHDVERVVWDNSDKLLEQETCTETVTAK